MYWNLIYECFFIYMSSFLLFWHDICIFACEFNLKRKRYGKEIYKNNVI